MKPDHYATLKVSRDAPPEVIRASYAALMRQAHPDLGGTKGLDATRLNEARRVLMDATRRADYDAMLDEVRDWDADRERGPAGMPEPAVDTATEPVWGEQSDWADPVVKPAPTTNTHDAPSPAPAPAPPVTPPPYPTDRTSQPPYGAATGGVGSSYVRVPGSAPTAHGLWRGVTKAERLTGAAWLLLSLVGPVASLADVVLDPRARDGWVGNAVVYAVLFAMSFHVAHRRIVSPGMPKRYVLLVLASLAATVSAFSSPLLAVYFGVWTALFIAATETRRRRLWHGRI